MAKKLISIIIPVYNMEKYLDRCMESVVSQTYENLEIILINDGSTDQSGQLCRHWQERDERIHYIEQENRGVSAARNAGILEASGDYIGFVDPDDWLEPDLYSYLAGLLESHRVQMAVCGTYLVYGEKCVGVQQQERIVRFSPEEAEKEMMKDGGGIFLTSLWNKLFIKSTVEGITFDESIHCMEDGLFLWEVLHKCSVIAVSNQKKYYYFQHFESAVNSQYSYKKHSELKAMKKIMGHCISKDNLLLCRKRYINQLVFFTMQAVRLDDKKQRKHWFDMLSKEVKKNKELIPYVRGKKWRVRGKILVFNKYCYYAAERLLYRYQQYRFREP